MSSGPYPSTYQEWIECLNRRHAVIDVGNKVRILSERDDPVLGKTTVSFLTVADFTLRYSNRTLQLSPDEDEASVASLWLASPDRRQYAGIIFHPGNDYPHLYNLWRGFGVKSAPGDCTAFWDFVLDVICGGDRDLLDYVRGYLAHMVQRPWELPEVALVLQGEQGTGKSFFVEQIGALFPNHFIQLVQRKHLAGSFNGHLAQAILVFADEGCFATPYVATILKGLITQHTLMMELKGIEAVPVPNYTRLVIASNEAKIIRAAAEERRYCVLQVSNSRQSDHAYFAKLSELMENGGRESLLWDLLHHDISNLNLRAIPQTRALQEQKEQSLDEKQRWWRDRLMAGEPTEGRRWSAVIERRQLQIDYENFCVSVGARYKDTQTELGRFLRKVIPHLGDMRRGGKRCYVLPSLAVCRAHFEKVTGCTFEWPDDDTNDAEADAAD